MQTLYIPVSDKAICIPVVDDDGHCMSVTDMPNSKDDDPWTLEPTAWSLTERAVKFVLDNGGQITGCQAYGFVKVSK